LHELQSIANTNQTPNWFMKHFETYGLRCFVGRP
jgi:hypothetical protein